jgi:hypothetical protein
LHIQIRGFASITIVALILTLPNQERAGSNIAKISPSSNTEDFGKATSAIIKMWYDKIKYYNYSHPGFSELTGHFT